MTTDDSSSTHRPMTAVTGTQPFRGIEEGVSAGAGPCACPARAPGCLAMPICSRTWMLGYAHAPGWSAGKERGQAREPPCVTPSHRLRMASYLDTHSD